MNDITIFPADIAEMSVSQLAALPPVQKREVDKNLDAAIDWLKKARTKFDAALVQCYGEQARAALRESGRDFGTAHISDGPLHIKFELPKKVSWNQKQLGEIAERIVALKALGLPLAEITDIVHARRTDAELRALLVARRAEIVTSIDDVEDHIPDGVVFMPKPWLPLELLRQAEISRQRHAVH